MGLVDKPGSELLESPDSGNLDGLPLVAWPGLTSFRFVPTQGGETIKTRAATITHFDEVQPRGGDTLSSRLAII